MAVANTTIIRRMIKELNKAQEQDHDQMMKKHISNVKLLCEIILEDQQMESKPVEQSELSSQEIKAMLGDQYRTDHKQINRKKRSHKTTNNHDQANGNSIFDF